MRPLLLLSTVVLLTSCATVGATAVSPNGSRPDSLIDPHTGRVANSTGSRQYYNNLQVMDPVVGAAANVALGLGAAGVSRAFGGCYASCPTGTVCNKATGLCDTLPCRGLCGSGERCDSTGLLEHCVRDAPDLEIQGTSSTHGMAPTPGPTAPLQPKLTPP